MVFWLGPTTFFWTFRVFWAYLHVCFVRPFNPKCRGCSNKTFFHSKNGVDGPLHSCFFVSCILAHHFLIWLITNHFQIHNVTVINNPKMCTAAPEHIILSGIKFPVLFFHQLTWRMGSNTQFIKFNICTSKITVLPYVIDDSRLFHCLKSLFFFCDGAEQWVCPKLFSVLVVFHHLLNQFGPSFLWTRWVCVEARSYLVCTAVLSFVCCLSPIRLNSSIWTDR